MGRNASFGFSRTSIVAQWVRDEIREVTPGIFLGVALWEKRSRRRISDSFRPEIPAQVAG